MNNVLKDKIRNRVNDAQADILNNKIKKLIDRNASEQEIRETIHNQLKEWGIRKNIESDK
tara:strand:+ start:339 stop:518 length:180 start_codon:yes stop_codon:yes gene_type:complete